MPDVSGLDLSALMRRALTGDQEAYREVLSLLVPVLRAMIRRRLHGARAPLADAEDVVQDTLLAIHLKRHTWDPEQPLNPWIAAIARNKTIDHLRRQGMRMTLPLDDLGDSLADPAARTDADAISSRHLLASLPARQRQIIEAITIEGRSSREVAQSLSMTEGAVRVALHRALKTLAIRFRTPDQT
jgi:RNA polymerase sigma-70 factor, ECF subfamily